MRSAKAPASPREDQKLTHRKRPLLRAESLSTEQRSGTGPNRIRSVWRGRSRGQRRRKKRAQIMNAEMERSAGARHNDIERGRARLGFRANPRGHRSVSKAHVQTQAQTQLEPTPVTRYVIIIIMLTIVNNARAGDELIRCKHLYADVDKNEV